MASHSLYIEGVCDVSWTTPDTKTREQLVQELADWWRSRPSMALADAIEGVDHLRRRPVAAEDSPEDGA